MHRWKNVQNDTIYAWQFFLSILSSFDLKTELDKHSHISLSSICQRELSNIQENSCQEYLTKSNIILLMCGPDGNS